MASKKSNEIKPSTLSERVVFNTTIGEDFEDAYGLNPKFATLSEIIFQRASRLLIGFVVSAITTKGVLERCPSSGGRAFVQRFVITIELSPFTRKAIDGCEALLSGAQSELPTDEIRQERIPGAGE